MSIEALRAIILKEMPSGENSKQLVALCKGEGKVLLSARGARQPKSKLLSGTQVFCYGDYQVYRGRGFLSVTAVDVLEDFYGLRTDVVKLAYAAYFAELTEKTVPEGMEADGVLLLLLHTLTVLSKSAFSPTLAARIFELKLLQHNGFLPEPDTLSRTFGLSAAASRAVEVIWQEEGRELFGFGLSERAVSELKAVSSAMLTEYLPLQLNTMGFLHTLNVE